MLQFGIIPKGKGSWGFTLLEILLVICVTGVLYIGFFNFFLESVNFFYGLNIRSEVIHQLRSGIESMAGELQKAHPASISLLELETGGYTQIQFYEYGSADQYWLYVNSSGSLIRAVRKPGLSWGRTVLAVDVDKLYLEMTKSGLIQLELVNLKKGSRYALTTIISAGF